MSTPNQTQNKQNKTNIQIRILVLYNAQLHKFIFLLLWLFHFKWTGHLPSVAVHTLFICFFTLMNGLLSKQKRVNMFTLKE